MIKRIIFKIISVLVIFQITFLNLYSNNISRNLFKNSHCLAPASLFRSNFHSLRDISNKIIECQIGNRLNEKKNQSSLIALWEGLDSQLQNFPEKDDFINITRDDLDALTILKIALRAAISIKLQISYADNEWVNNARQTAYLFVQILRHPSISTNINILEELLYIFQDFIRFGEAPSIVFNEHLYKGATTSLDMNKYPSFFASRKRLTLWFSVMKLSINSASSNLEKEAARQLGKVLFPHLWPGGKLFNPKKRQMKVSKIWDILFKNSSDFYVINFNRSKELNPTMKGFDSFELPLSIVREKGIKPLFYDKLGKLSSLISIANFSNLSNFNVKKSYLLIASVFLIISIFFNYTDFSSLTDNPYKNIKVAEKCLVMRDPSQEITLKTLNMINYLVIQSNENLENGFENIRVITSQLINNIDIDISISSLIIHLNKLKNYRIYLKDNYPEHYLIKYLKILEVDIEGVISFRLKKNIFSKSQKGTLGFIDIESLISWISIKKGALSKKELDTFILKLRRELQNNKGNVEPFYSLRVDINSALQGLKTTLGKDRKKVVIIHKTIKTLEKILKTLPVLPEMKTEWKKGYLRDLSRQNYYNNWIFSVCKSYSIPQMIFKSIMLQETEGKEWVSNQHGFAGLMQVGRQEALDAGYSIGKTKFIEDGKGGGRWIFDKKRDERFDPFKSIQMAAFVLNQKIIRIDNFFKDNNIGEPLNEMERWKLYIAAYNIGGGTVTRAISNHYSGSGNLIKWKDLTTSKSGRVQDSAICQEMPVKWDRKAKYKEITSFVSWVVRRASQSSKHLFVLNEIKWKGNSKTKENIARIIERNFVRHYLTKKDVIDLVDKLKQSEVALLKVSA